MLNTLNIHNTDAASDMLILAILLEYIIVYWGIYIVDYINLHLNM